MGLIITLWKGRSCSASQRPSGQAQGTFRVKKEWEEGKGESRPRRGPADTGNRTGAKLTAMRKKGIFQISRKGLSMRFVVWPAKSFRRKRRKKGRARRGEFDRERSSFRTSSVDREEDLPEG